MNPEPEHLIIRADANSQIGTGHFMRCLALAQAWKDAGGKVLFITACRNEGMLQRLRDEGFKVHILPAPYPDPAEWTEMQPVLAVHARAWLVLDGYHFDERYQQWVKSLGCPLMVIDDMANLNRYYADVIVNQNLHAERLSYPCEDYTRLLLGISYVLLRREFRDQGSVVRPFTDVAQRVLVTLGGADPDNYTEKVVQALEKANVPGLEATVIIGSHNMHRKAIENAAQRSSVPITPVLDAADMPRLMAEADMAIAGAGSTVWELAYMGMPSILLVLARNQLGIAAQMQSDGAAKSLGCAHDVSDQELALSIASLAGDREGRTHMGMQARRLVDGQGTRRIISFLRDSSIFPGVIAHGIS